MYSTKKKIYILICARFLVPTTGTLIVNFIFLLLISLNYHVKVTALNINNKFINNKRKGFT